MDKSLFEQMGGTYTEQGDYRLPNLTLPQQSPQNYGVWGYRRLRFLKEHHKLFYYNLLTAGRLGEHLADVDKQAQELYSRLVNWYAKAENLDEKMKAERSLEWVGQMNDIRNRVTEVVLREVVCV